MGSGWEYTGSSIGDFQVRETIKTGLYEIYKKKCVQVDVSLVH